MIFDEKLFEELDLKDNGGIQSAFGKETEGKINQGHIGKKR